MLGLIYRACVQLPISRLLFPFDETGYYFADFTIYPKTGAAIVFRIGVVVK